MNIRTLEYLVALSEYRHFGKAAEKCFVSQPALSMQIKNLENILGVQLLERNHKSIFLAPIGKIIAAHAKGILCQMKEIKEMEKLASDPFSGELKIGIIPTLAPYLLPLIMSTLSREFPKLSFYLVEEQTVLLLNKLIEGKLDLAILALPIEEENLSIIPLFEENFFLAISKRSNLAKRKKIVFDDLNEENILLLEEGHCMRESTLQICHRMKVYENKDFRATSLETLRQMVAINAGITFMPALACKKQKEIAYLPVEGLHFTRRIGLISRESCARKALLKELGLTIKKLIGKNSLVKLL